MLGIYLGTEISALQKNQSTFYPHEAYDPKGGTGSNLKLHV